MCGLKHYVFRCKSFHRQLRTLLDHLWRRMDENVLTLDTAERHSDLFWHLPSLVAGSPVLPHIHHMALRHTGATHTHTHTFIPALYPHYLDLHLKPVSTAIGNHRCSADSACWERRCVHTRVVLLLLCASELKQQIVHDCIILPKALRRRGSRNCLFAPSTLGRSVKLRY